MKDAGCGWPAGYDLADRLGCGRHKHSPPATLAFKEDRAVTYVTRGRNDLGRGFEESLQTDNILYDDLSCIHLQQSFGLEAHQIAGNEFAYGSELIGKFLMGCGKLKFNSARSLLALAFCEFERVRRSNAGGSW